MMDKCEWCLDGKTCRSGNEKDCDFKTLKKTKEDMRKRIDEEFTKVDELLTEVKDAKDTVEANKNIFLVKDKVQGIGIIRQELMEKFNDNYFPKGRIKFMQTLLSVNKHMRRVK